MRLRGCQRFVLYIVGFDCRCSSMTVRSCNCTFIALRSPVGNISLTLYLAAWPARITCDRILKLVWWRKHVEE